MDRRNNPMARGACYLLIYLTSVYPLHPAIAAGITPDNNHTQVQNQGNIPVVNIATPNGAGISHNTYKEFNVATQGAVLNNATQAAKSQLAGQINANSNLKGKAAELIINEVTGNGRSDLQGKLEVVGNKANVMIANPNGITCDGCGFINTSSATLTTGKPQFDKQGALEALEVKKGQITIGGKGLDGKATDYIDIISRATELNGKIQANNLSFTQGANRIDFNDGTVKKITGEGAKPQLAVDTKALGGMYANKIRLVATEDGVGVNLKDLISDQRDITLNVNGKIELGNAKAKMDFNLSARETHIAPNIKIQAERDITLANTALENKGSVTAGRDMRVFGDTVRNTGDKALLQANNNMWIQKDAQGNKGQLVENRSATIKTVKGDLVVRTNALNNARSIYYFEKRETAPNPADKNFNILEAQYKHGHNLKSMQPSVLTSGGNIYINSDILSNQELSKIEAEKDIFLTGKKLLNTSRISEETSGYLNLFEYFPKDTYVSITDSLNTPSGIYKLSSNKILEKINTYHQWDDKSYHILSPGEVKYDIKEDNLILERASIIAKGNLIADFSDSINIDTDYPHKSPSGLGLFNDRPIDSEKLPEILSAKNILLHGGQITLKDKIRAFDELNIISENDIVLKNSILSSQNSLSIAAVNNINIWKSNIKGRDVTAISRNGDIQFKNGDQFGYLWGQYATGDHPASNKLGASGNLTINAGKNLLLQNVYLQPSKNISLIANSDVTIENHADTYIFAKSKKRNERLPIAGMLNASESLTINAGGNLYAKGSDMSAGKDIYLSAAKQIDLSSAELGDRGSLLIPSDSSELSSKIFAKNNISIMSGGDIHGKAVQIQANGNTLLSAGGNITLPSLAYSAINKANDNNKDDRHIIAQVRGDKKLTIAANGTLTTAGTKLTSDGDVTLSSGGNMRFESVQNHTYREGNREFTESVTQQGTELTSGGVLTVISNGSILLQATKLATKRCDGCRGKRWLSIRSGDGRIQPL
ncbi:filamentous hemagglutinin N-terminal domain-containing protein [Photorhabdus viridis]|uniref:filamentous hemagglutinin N-terminal domain-containing protein n=1 Tax=Photorhabdus viridis TaxID=3163327 RepID=UPI0033078F08